ncbi:MAG: T9SS type A sorting domain-containing protein [Bacteroidetes bacterium]|nr:T9SS type A sorting domain-containing protein [Bacteroidota bacterium]
MALFFILSKKLISSFVLCIFYFGFFFAQLKINEGCNKNYQSIQDEDGNAPDWIELYNSGTDTVNLESYSLTDDSNFPKKNGSFHKRTAYEIFDLNGRKISFGELNTAGLQTEIDVRSFRSSIYFVRIKQKNMNLDVIRFVKN